MLGDIGCGCAKKLKPNLYLHDDQARRDYFCEEATPEEQQQFEDCFNEGVEALNDDQVFKILNDCYNIA
uniref:Cellular protein AbCp-14 n=1 Tax=Androctonus bicolor TaxID=748906 RepID=A0A0K0LC62_9SCOR|nr:cellular protein AbCp-14 [Androctonus bicolor]